MTKFLICNVQKDNNFGGPSIILGLCELLKKTNCSEFVVENIQAGYVLTANENDIPIVTRYYNPPSLRSFHKFLFGDQNCLSLAQLIKYIYQFDIIIDAYGICFCDKLDNRDMGVIKTRLAVFRKFTVSIIAKRILHKKVIKNIASFGPIKHSFNRNSSEYMSSKVFDVIAAREMESKNWMSCVTKKDIFLSPDVANIVKVEKCNVESKVIISISHMIKKQWKSEEDYIECMSACCLLIIKKYKYKVLLLPNECNPNYYNDLDVAKEIAQMVSNENLIIIPANKMSCIEIKKEIATSRIMIGSRYHSCVAALSSGVPTIVIGWHNKYLELMKIYGQESWIIKEDECNHFKLFDLFERIDCSYEIVKNEIKNRYIEVERRIIETGYRMYGYDTELISKEMHK